MRILFDQQTFSMQQVGGISRYFAQLAVQLCHTERVAAKIVSPLCTNEYARTMPRHCLLGIPVKGGRRTRRLLRFTNEKCARWIIDRQRPDIVHQTYYPKRAVHYRHGPKMVTTVHDMIYELFPQDFPARDRTAQYKRRALENADHVICVSENTRTELVRLNGVDPAKTTVVHHGADHLRYGKLPAAGGQGVPYLLYVGKRGSYKNFRCALQAYAETPGLMAAFDLVCFGGGPLSRNERQLASRLGIAEKKLVSVHGPDKMLAGLYQHAAAFIYPSLYEGFGLPPLEAMSQGCPVISSNTSSLPEVLGDAPEYFDPNDNTDLGRALERVLNDAGRAAELKASGRARASEYTWHRCAEETLKVYEKLLGRTER